MSRRRAPVLPAGDPAVRARVMVLSMRSHAHAWLGWLPLVGMVFCVRSLVWARRARRETSGQWNPAGRYLRAASWIAGTALLVWLSLTGLLLLALLNSLG